MWKEIEEEDFLKETRNEPLNGGCRVGGQPVGQWATGPGTPRLLWLLSLWGCAIGSGAFLYLLTKTLIRRDIIASAHQSFVNIAAVDGDVPRNYIPIADAATTHPNHGAAPSYIPPESPREFRNEEKRRFLRFSTLIRNTRAGFCLEKRVIKRYDLFVSQTFLWWCRGGIGGKFCYYHFSCSQLGRINFFDGSVL